MSTTTVVPPRAFTLQYQLPQATLSAHMPDRTTVVADVVFAGAAVEVAETSFAVLLTGGLEHDSQTLSPVEGADGSRATHWQLVVRLRGPQASGGSVAVTFTGADAYPPTTVPDAIVIPVVAATPATLQAQSHSGYTINDGRTTRMHTFVYEVTFEQASTFQSSDLLVTVAGDASVVLDTAAVDGSRWVGWLVGCAHYDGARHASDLACGL